MFWGVINVIEEFFPYQKQFILDSQCPLLTARENLHLSDPLPGRVTSGSKLLPGVKILKWHGHQQWPDCGTIIVPLCSYQALHIAIYTLPVFPCLYFEQVYSFCVFHTFVFPVLIVLPGLNFCCLFFDNVIICIMIWIDLLLDFVIKSAHGSQMCCLWGFLTDVKYFRRKQALLM